MTSGIYPTDSDDPLIYDASNFYCPPAQSGICSKRFDFEGDYGFTSGKLTGYKVGFGGNVVVNKRTLNEVEDVLVLVKG